MKRLMLAVLMGVSICSASSIIGFEDGTDFDYNDTVVTVTGVNFHTIGSWTVPNNLPFPNENSFPGGKGFFFDTSVATGDVTVIQDFQQTSVTEHMSVEVGDGPWLVITGALLSLQANVGDTVRFRLDDSAGSLYPTGNPDGMPHAVEETLAPEPEDSLLIGGGLILVYLVSKFRN